MRPPCLIYLSTSKPRCAVLIQSTTNSVGPILCLFLSYVPVVSRGCFRRVCVTIRKQTCGVLRVASSKIKARGTPTASLTGMGGVSYVRRVVRHHLSGVRSHFYAIICIKIKAVPTGGWDPALRLLVQYHLALCYRI